MSCSPVKQSIEEEMVDLQAQNKMKQNAMRQRKDLDLFDEIICLSAMVQSLKSDKSNLMSDLKLCRPSEDIVRESEGIKAESADLKAEVQYLKSLVSEMKDQHSKEIKSLQRALKDNSTSSKPFPASDPYKARRQEITDLSEKLCKATIQRDEFAKQEMRAHASLVTLQNQMKASMKEMSNLEKKNGQLESKLKKEKLRASWMATAAIRNDPTAAGRKQEFQLPQSDAALESGRLTLETTIISMEEEAIHYRQNKALEFEKELQQLESKMKSFADSGVKLNEKYSICAEQSGMLMRQISLMRDELENSLSDCKNWQGICDRKDSIIKSLSGALRARYMASTVSGTGTDLILDEEKNELDNLLAKAEEASRGYSEALVDEVTAELSTLSANTSYEKKQITAQLKAKNIKATEESQLQETIDNQNLEIKMLNIEIENLKSKLQSAISAAQGSTKITQTLQNQIGVLQKHYGQLYDELLARGVTELNGKVLMSDPCISIL